MKTATDAIENRACGGTLNGAESLACPLGETGRRNGLKIRSPQGGGGSSPPAGTTSISAGYSPLSDIAGARRNWGVCVIPV